MKYFLIDQDDLLHLEHVRLAKRAVDFQIWRGNTDVRLVSSLDDIRSDATLIVPVGSVEFVRSIFAMYSQVFFNENWPSDIRLDHFVQSRSWEYSSSPYKSLYTFGSCKLSEIDGAVKDFPIFIKPKFDSTLFHGELLRDSTDLQSLYDLVVGVNGRQMDGNTEVYYSVPINFIAEFRAIIHNGKLLALSEYSVDETLPDPLKCLYDSKSVCYNKMFSGPYSILNTIDSSFARIVDVGMPEQGVPAVVECANNILTAATYTSFIDVVAYYKALCSCGIKLI